MALENDLEMFGRRMNNLESPQNYIRIGTFLGYEEGFIARYSVLPVTTTEANRHSHVVHLTQTHILPPSGRGFLQGHVWWAEEDISKEGMAILPAPKSYLYFGRNDREAVEGRIPHPLFPGDQILLLFVSGLIFGIPFTETSEEE